MCFGKKEASAENDEGFRRNADIEKALREDKKRLAREIKILLLGKPMADGTIIQLRCRHSANCVSGAGESGKSTILKQMKMIYAEGFSPADRKQWRVVIFTNLVNAFQTILTAMEEQEVPFSNPGNNVRDQNFVRL